MRTTRLSALRETPWPPSRVHAQIGAGLFLSAASNLRVARQPRDHRGRFNVALAPSEARSRKMPSIGGIERGSDRMAADASLLLAYLGRLHDDPAMRSEGLAAWKSRIAEADVAEAALHELLSKVWGTAP